VAAGRLLASSDEDRIETNVRGVGIDDEFVIPRLPDLSSGSLGVTGHGQTED
jgi:hypothetical protein